MIETNKISNEIIGKLGNDDLVRLIFWFCSDDYPTENGLGKRFKYVTKIQKLVFLAQNEFPEFIKLQDLNIFKDTPFIFTADNFGPFSADLEKLLNKMRREGEIAIEKEQGYKVYYIQEKLKGKISEIVSIFEPSQDNMLLFKSWISRIYTASQMKLDDLLRHIYTNPSYSNLLTNSKIKNKFS